MKAIKTKYVGATSNQPSRIRASAEGVKAVFYSLNAIQNEIDSNRADVWHHLVAEKFRDANGWKHYGGNPEAPVQDLASGQLDADTHVHCFIEGKKHFISICPCGAIHRCNDAWKFLAGKTTRFFCHSCGSFAEQRITYAIEK